LVFVIIIFFFPFQVTSGNADSNTAAVSPSSALPSFSPFSFSAPTSTTTSSALSGLPSSSLPLPTSATLSPSATTTSAATSSPLHRSVLTKRSAVSSAGMFSPAHQQQDAQYAGFGAASPSFADGPGFCVSPQYDRRQRARLLPTNSGGGVGVIGGSGANAGATATTALVNPLEMTSVAQASTARQPRRTALFSLEEVRDIVDQAVLEAMSSKVEEVRELFRDEFATRLADEHQRMSEHYEAHISEKLNNSVFSYMS
jgi:hypothetical protein